MVNEFDVEMLHYNIKNNINIEAFSDRIVDFLNELMKQNKYAPELVKNTYKAIGNCFVSNAKSVDNDLKESEISTSLREWICSKCGNCNICQHVNGKINYDLAICQLCGIEQIDSIMLKIRDDETFISISNTDDTDDTDDTISNKKHLNSIQKCAQKFNLKCLNRTDNIVCPSIKRLA
eukprot:509870_1